MNGMDPVWEQTEQFRNAYFAVASLSHVIDWRRISCNSQQA